ncbi:DUF4190 domain-containing protein [Streptomyces sp. NPDC001450]
MPFVGLITGPLAVIFASKARKEIKRTGQKGDGMAIAGLVTGILGCVGYGIFLLILIIAAVVGDTDGKTSTPVKVETSASAPTATNSATPSATAQTEGKAVTFSGKGQKKTERVELSGDYNIKWTYKDNVLGPGDTGSNFVAALQGTGNTTAFESLVNEIGRSGSGDTNVYDLEKGTYYIDVQFAQGRWTFTITPK